MIKFNDLYMQGVPELVIRNVRGDKTGQNKQLPKSKMGSDRKRRDAEGRFP